MFKGTFKFDLNSYHHHIKENACATSLKGSETRNFQHPVLYMNWKLQRVYEWLPSGFRFDFDFEEILMFENIQA
jgi:hypothetical protein